MKRLIALILALTMMVGMFIGCDNFKFNEDNPDNATRGQWIEVLSATLGMDEYNESTPYFSDVKSDDSLFGYVQSGYEWGVLNSVGKKLSKNSDASTEFVAITAAKSVDSSFTDKQAIEYAKKNGIITGDIGDRSFVTVGKLQEIANKTQELYLNYKHNYEDKVTFVDGVQDLSKSTESVQRISDSTYKLDNVTPKVGDIYITPGTPESPSGVAVKVSSVTQNSDGTYTVETVEPELSEVVTEISVSEIAVPKAENVILADGVEMVSGGDYATQSSSVVSDADVTPLVGKVGSDATLVKNDKPKGASFSFEVSFIKGRAGINKSWGDISSSASQLIPDIGSASPKLGEWFEKSTVIPDKTLFGPDAYNYDGVIEEYNQGKISADELKAKLSKIQDENGNEKIPNMINKFSGGYDIKGSIGIENFYVHPEIKVNTLKVFGVDTKIPTGIECISVEVNADITAKLSMEGSLKEELTVCSFPIPVASTGITVTVDLTLYAEANGELSVKATVNSNTKIEYSKGNFKKTSSKTSSLEAELSITIEAGPQIGVTLEFLSMDIVDVDVSFAMLIEASAKAVLSSSIAVDDENITIQRTTKFVVGVDGYVPIIKLSFASSPKTLANKLKLSKTFTLVSKEKAYNFDILPEQEFILFEDTLVLPRDVEKKEEDTSSNNQNSSVGEGSNNNATTGKLDVSEYFINLNKGQSKRIEITSMPSGYSTSDFKWISSDSSIVRVGSDGTITGVDSGMATVTVESKDGKHNIMVSVSISD